MWVCYSMIPWVLWLVSVVRSALGWLIWLFVVTLRCRCWLLRLSFAVLGFAEFASCWFSFLVFRANFVFMWRGGALRWWGLGGWRMC